MYRGKAHFRSPTWLMVFMSAAAVLVPVLTIVEYQKEALNWVFFGLLTFSVVMIVGVAHVFTEKIQLGETELKITHNFKSKVVPRASIEKATWAKGCETLLLLKDGDSIKLPDVGDNSQSLCNSIRAWVKAA